MAILVCRWGEWVICSLGKRIGCGWPLSQPQVCLIMVGLHVLGYRKAKGGEGKGLDSRGAGFDAGNGRGSMGEHRSGVLMAARVMSEMMTWPPGDVDQQ